MSCIFQLPFTQQRPRRTRPQPAGEEQPSTRGQASGCPSPDAAPPQTVAGETGCFHSRVLVGQGPLGSRGWRGPPHSVPEKKTCVSIQNGSFTGNQIPARVSLGARVSTLPTHLAQGPLAGSRGGATSGSTAQSSQLSQDGGPQAQPVESGQGAPTGSLRGDAPA